MDNLKLNDTISYFRKKQGLTQEELAKELGVTNQSVSKWESAQCCPDISLIPKLAEIFDISIDELFGKEPIVNDICAQFPLRDDDTFRVVVARGKRIVSVENLDKTIDITFPRNCNETTRQYFKVEVFGNIFCDASICGDVNCGGNIFCDASICGDVNCGGNIECKTIEGNVECQGNIIYK